MHYNSASSRVQMQCIERDLLSATNADWHSAHTIHHSSPHTAQLLPVTLATAVLAAHSMVSAIVAATLYISAAAG
jgi:hypothetical protein